MPFQFSFITSSGLKNCVAQMATVNVDTVLKSFSKINHHSFKHVMRNRIDFFQLLLLLGVLKLMVGVHKLEISHNPIEKSHTDLDPGNVKATQCHPAEK